MFTTKSVSALAVVSLCLFAGCASPAAEHAATSDTALESAAVENTTVEAGSFKLYDDPESAPLPECDLHTRLVLKNIGNGFATAELRDVVAGTCEIYVEPNTREYQVEFEMDRCGSWQLTGDAVIKGEKRHVSITDNRQRLCRDLQPMLVVNESDAVGNLTQRFASF